MPALRLLSLPARAAGVSGPKPKPVLVLFPGVTRPEYEVELVEAAKLSLPVLPAGVILPLVPVLDEVLALNNPDIVSLALVLDATEGGLETPVTPTVARLSFPTATKTPHIDSH